MADEVLCCEECFADPHLRGQAAESGVVGECDFCGCTGVSVLPPDELNGMFEHIFDYYEIVQRGRHYLGDADPTSYGSPLDLALEGDGWRVFSDQLVGRGSQDLLQAILGPGVEVRDLWTTADRRWTIEPGEDAWSLLRNGLLEHRRFFSHLPENFLARCADLLTTYEEELPQGHPLYRARRGGTDPDWEGRPTRAYPPEGMGAPPPSADRFGRANPPGISYLYAATDPATAVAEMRPAREARLSLARLELARPAMVVDLSAVKPLGSLFEVREYFGIPSLKVPLEDRQILLRFARELCRPVWPGDAAIDYLPTQYLAEFILDLGYDGLLYPSGFSDGENVVLFDPGACTAVESDLAEVERVTVNVIHYLDE